MDMIGRHRAAVIESIAPQNRTKEQESLLSEYKARLEPTEEQKKRRVEYGLKLAEEKPKRADNGFTFHELYDLTLYHFRRLESKQMLITEDYHIGLKTLLYYFSEDQRFFNSPVLLKDLSIPSFGKGVLVVGDYGSGKSTLMHTICAAFLQVGAKRFQIFSANKVVDQFESCEKSNDRDIFWNRMVYGHKCFDDVKTEREASNYGKVNLFKEIIERRYEKRQKTHIVCNYREGQPGDVYAGLSEFGELYGSRAYDRIFEMFNIIEFKGKSFRK